VFRQLQYAAASILALPGYFGAVSVQVKPVIAVPYQDPFFAQLDRRLPASVQSVRRGVAAQQGSERNPKLYIQRF
jgi:hypothetical protein